MKEEVLIFLLGVAACCAVAYAQDLWYDDLDMDYAPIAYAPQYPSGYTQQPLADRGRQDFGGGYGGGYGGNGGGYGGGGGWGGGKKKGKGKKKKGKGKKKGCKKGGCGWGWRPPPVFVKYGWDGWGKEQPHLHYQGWR